MKLCIACVPKFLLIVCLALFGCVSVDGKEQPLQLSISSAKKVYTEGEAIDLVATLKNTGKTAARIYSPEYWGVSEIVVEDSAGVRVSPRGIKVERIPFDSFIVIPPGEGRSVRFENLRWYLCGSAQEFAGTAQLPRGIYTIYVTVTNPPVYECFEDPGNPRKPFEKTDLVGKLTSNKITLRVEAAKGEQ